MTIGPATDIVASPTPQRRRLVSHHNNQSNSKMSPILSPGNRRRKEIGDYWLGKTLGKGSSGRVKLGVHKDTGQKVAVKIISKSHLNSHASVERSVKREIAVMKLIKHPNIINFIDVIDLPDATNLYLILEYIEGGELFEYLISCGKLTEKEARKYFQQIIFGLDYCHRHLICHRDLKPENLLLDNEKNIKICDFGMASLQPTGSLLETSCGSPHYASPEIVNGIPYNGAASDIWSCGVILYALLNGHLPFDDDNIHNLLKKVKEGKYNMSKDIPTKARDLIEKILVTDPSKRFTMTEVQAHPWFTVDIPPTPCILPSPPSAGEIGKKLADEDEIDDRILATLQDLWTDLSSTQLIEALQNEEYNMQKVTYVLLQRYSADYWQKMQDDEIQAASTTKRQRPATICAVTSSGKEAFSGLNEMMLKLAEHGNDTLTSPPPGIQHNHDQKRSSAATENNKDAPSLQPVRSDTPDESPPPLPPKPKIVRTDLHCPSPNPTHTTLKYTQSPCMVSHSSSPKQKQPQQQQCRLQKDKMKHSIPPIRLPSLRRSRQPPPSTVHDQQSPTASIHQSHHIPKRQQYHFYNPYAYQVPPPRQPSPLSPQLQHQNIHHMLSPHVAHSQFGQHIPYHQSPLSVMSSYESQSSYCNYMDLSYHYQLDPSHHHQQYTGQPPYQAHQQELYQKAEPSKLKGLMHHLWRSTSRGRSNSNSSKTRPPSFVSSQKSSNKISPVPAKSHPISERPIQGTLHAPSLLVPQQPLPPQYQQQHYHHPYYSQHPQQHPMYIYAPQQHQHGSSPLASSPMSPVDSDQSFGPHSSTISTIPSVSGENPQRSPWTPALYCYKEPKICTLDCVATMESEALKKTAHVLEKYMNGKIEEREENGRVRRRGEFVLIQDSKSVMIRFKLKVYQLPDVTRQGQDQSTFRLHFIQIQGDGMALMMGVQWIEQTLQAHSCYGQPQNHQCNTPPLEFLS